jgi:hypothetical protein
MEGIVEQQSTEIIHLREERADHLTKLMALEEFKDLTGKDLKHKVQLLS